MVRRRKISQAGVQQHPAETLDNEIPAAAVPDGSGTDKTGDIMTEHPMSNYRAAYELGHSVNNGMELVVECLEWILKRKDGLIRRLREGSISKDEFNEDMAEIRLLHQQVKEFSEQLDSFQKKVKKVFENDENNN